MAWKLDLDKLLQVFQVCSVSSVLSSLIVCSQTQLSINTNVIASEIHENVINTHSVVSGLQRDVTATLSDIHRAVVVKPEGANYKNSLVGVTSTLLIAEPILTIT